MSVLGVGGFGAQLGQCLTRGLAGLLNLDAGGLGELCRRHFAPALVGAANGVDAAALGLGCKGAGQQSSSHRQTEAFHGVS